jgi:aspartyl-tRNA(Asn)/glutamyl-tRNA(Gln) amidotransferase subunit C
MDIDKNEIKDIEEKLSKIIDFVDQLQTISTDDIEPMAHPLNQSQRLRMDEVTETNDRENIQKKCPTNRKRNVSRSKGYRLICLIRRYII